MGIGEDTTPANVLAALYLRRVPAIDNQVP
jgi:hypothetical protein